MGFPKFTNYQKKFHGTIDHIIYQKDNLLLLALLKLPGLLEISKDPLPNNKYPSDHIPILGVFKMT